MSIDPQRVYVPDPSQTRHTCVEAAAPGPNGERWCWWQCTVKGGREARDIDAVAVARAVEALGAGEIMLNCIDNDGRGQVRVFGGAGWKGVCVWVRVSCVGWAGGTGGAPQGERLKGALRRVGRCLPPAPGVGRTAHEPASSTGPPAPRGHRPRAAQGPAPS